MPYYSAGDYYGAGDHIYGRGDFLGIGKFAKKALSFGAGIVGKLGIPVVSGVANVVSGMTAARPNVSPALTMIPGFGGGAGPGVMVPEPGIAGIAHRAAEGGHPGYGRYTKDGRFTDRARPRMQVTNTRALKRAGRRVRGFLKLASKLGALPVSRSAKGKLFKRKRR